MRLNRLSITALVLVTACASASHAAPQRSSDDPYVWTGTLHSGATLTIRNINGPIDVRSGSGDRVEVRAERRTSSRNSSDLTFESRHEGDDVIVCSVWRGRSGCDDHRDWDGDVDGNAAWARMTITLPKDARLDASTGNGAVSVIDAGGDVKVNTGNGEIRIEGTSGTVRANTGNGAVLVSDAHGRVQANTGNGHVRITTSTGPVSVSTGNGDIEARMNTLAKDADMQFHTGSGSVIVTVPSDLDADFDASTGNGSIRTDFEIRVTGSLNPRHIRGTIGHGGGSIHMTTGNGSVELRKAT